MRNTTVTLVVCALVLVAMLATAAVAQVGTAQSGEGGCGIPGVDDYNSHLEDYNNQQKGQNGSVGTAQSGEPNGDRDGKPQDKGGKDGQVGQPCSGEPGKDVKEPEEPKAKVKEKPKTQPAKPKGQACEATRPAPPAERHEARPVQAAPPAEVFWGKIKAQFGKLIGGLRTDVDNLREDVDTNAKAIDKTNERLGVPGEEGSIEDMRAQSQDLDLRKTARKADKAFEAVYGDQDPDKARIPAPLIDRGGGIPLWRTILDLVWKSLLSIAVIWCIWKILTSGRATGEGEGEEEEEEEDEGRVVTPLALDSETDDAWQAYQRCVGGNALDPEVEAIRRSYQAVQGSPDDVNVRIGFFNILAEFCNMLNHCLVDRNNALETWRTFKASKASESANHPGLTRLQEGLRDEDAEALSKLAEAVREVAQMAKDVAQAQERHALSLEQTTAGDPGTEEARTTADNWLAQAEALEEKAAEIRQGAENVRSGEDSGISDGATLSFLRVSPEYGEELQTTSRPAPRLAAPDNHARGDGDEEGTNGAATGASIFLLVFAGVRLLAGDWLFSIFTGQPIIPFAVTILGLIAIVLVTIPVFGWKRLVGIVFAVVTVGLLITGITPRDELTAIWRWWYVAGGLVIVAVGGLLAYASAIDFLDRRQGQASENALNKPWAIVFTVFGIVMILMGTVIATNYAFNLGLLRKV